MRHISIEAVVRNPIIGMGNHQNLLWETLQSFLDTDRVSSLLPNILIAIFHQKMIPLSWNYHLGPSATPLTSVPYRDRFLFDIHMLVWFWSMKILYFFFYYLFVYRMRRIRMIQRSQVLGMDIINLRLLFLCQQLLKVLKNWKHCGIWTSQASK